MSRGSIRTLALAAACLWGLHAAPSAHAQRPDASGSPAPVETAVRPFTRELWVHALRLDPSVGESGFGVTLEGIYHFASRAHDRWRRNVPAEALARPQSWARVEIGYDPESALITGGGGVHFYGEGVFALGERFGGGGYARYDHAVSEAEALVDDIEVGAMLAFWSDERRTHITERVGYRRVSADRYLPEVDEGSFLQVRHHLVYVPSEDWSVTFVQDGALSVGIGSDPHTNVLRVENIFLISPVMVFSAGPIIGVDLAYFVGPATSALSIPVGARVEAHPGRVVAAIVATYDVATIAGQRTAGLILRASAGFRF